MDSEGQPSVRFHDLLSGGVRVPPRAQTGRPVRLEEEGMTRDDDVRDTVTFLENEIAIEKRTIQIATDRLRHHLRSLKAVSEADHRKVIREMEEPARLLLDPPS